MNEGRKHIKGGPIVLIGLILFILVALLFLLQRFVFLPKILIIVLIILSAVFIGEFRCLIKDWFVFIAFVYLFDSLRGGIYLLTCKLGLPVYTLYVIKIDRFLFSEVPSVLLQKWLLNPNDLSWLEKVSTVIHGSHFIAFLLVGFLIWLNRPNTFRLYKTSFYLLMILGLFFYLVVPTTPPWLASNQFNRIPPLNHFNVVLFNMVIPDICNGFDINPVAAMPSLHSAFPILCSVLLWSIFRWKAFPFYLYSLTVLFTIIYTGDHYVTDVLAGLILALACYFTASKIINKKTEKPGNPLPEQTTFGFSNLKGSITVGLILLILGFSIGSINKREFFNHPNEYSLNAPRYVDLFNHKERYGTDFHIQMYFGKYYSAREEYKEALPSFQNALKVALNPTQEKNASWQITFCHRMIHAQKNWLKIQGHY